ncbi:hypothetical protein [Thermogutta sp.]|jgi:energy-coupling factor transporter ATP-binding protein EcfA2|uniref:hypothetical protein n=1 Tax=Thermogutta sp. TaxID=1962930 RepID=UPI00321FFAE9
MLPDLEQRNIQQLEDLNQRGGRMLTVVDLIEAGTLSADMVATVMYALAQGASLLTAARPGGAGKTTLLAAFLNLLPPGVKIITVDTPSVVGQALQVAPPTPECFLVHEIGDGHWYGYLWGRPVADYFRLISAQRRIASCLHADTLQELTEILLGPPLGVARGDLDRVGLFAFIHVDFSVSQGYRPRRRVASLECRAPFVPKSFRFVWDPLADNFAVALPDDGGRRRSAPDEALTTWFAGPVFGLFRDFISELVEKGVRHLADVRREVLGFYREHPELIKR